MNYTKQSLENFKKLNYRYHLSKCNRGFCLLLCVIDVFSKNAWVILLKDKKGEMITKAFQKNCERMKL